MPFAAITTLKSDAVAKAVRLAIEGVDPSHASIPALTGVMEDWLKYMIGLAAKAPLDDLFEAVRLVGSSGIHGEIFVEFDKTREHHELNLLILLLESRNLEIGTISMETDTWWCAVRDKQVTDAAELVFVPVAEAIRLKLN